MFAPPCGSSTPGIASHDDVAHGEELFALQRLREEIRQIVDGVHVRYRELAILDTFPNEGGGASMSQHERPHAGARFVPARGPPTPA
eukprot:2602423-Prymnesium_polylepis.1